MNYEIVTTKVEVYDNELKELLYDLELVDEKCFEINLIHNIFTQESLQDFIMSLTEAANQLCKKNNLKT
jgi:hypothetical protein